MKLVRVALAALGLLALASVPATAAPKGPKPITVSAAYTGPGYLFAFCANHDLTYGGADIVPASLPATGITIPFALGAPCFEIPSPKYKKYDLQVVDNSGQVVWTAVQYLTKDGNGTVIVDGTGNPVTQYTCTTMTKNLRIPARSSELIAAAVDAVGATAYLPSTCPGIANTPTSGTITITFHG